MDWNGDRAAPDYDPQRDPSNPLSPVFGQYSRRPWIREAARDPFIWAVAAYIVATLSLILLHATSVISLDAVLIGQLVKILLVFIALSIAVVWSAVVWFRKTPPTERGPSFRRWLKSWLPWIMGFIAFAIASD